MYKVYTKTLLSIIMLMSAVSSVSALTLRQVLADMPDSILPLYTKNDRLDFIDFIDNNMKAEVKNRLGELTLMTVLTDDFCHINMAEGSTIEMKVLNDSTFCVVNSVKASGWDSDIRVYKSDWTEIPASRFYDLPAVGEFIPQPEGMGAVQYRNLLNRAETPLYHMEFHEGTTDLTVTYSTSAISDKEYEKELKPYIHPTLTLPLKR